MERTFNEAERRWELRLDDNESLVADGRLTYEPLNRIMGEKINLHGSAYTDGREYLVFFGDRSLQDRFIYYMGGEREAELETRWGGVSVYTGLSESRLSHGLERWKDLPEAQRPSDVDPDEPSEYHVVLTPYVFSSDPDLELDT